MIGLAKGKYKDPGLTKAVHAFMALIMDVIHNPYKIVLYIRVQHTKLLCAQITGIYK